MLVACLFIGLLILISAGDIHFLLPFIEGDLLVLYSSNPAGSGFPTCIHEWALLRLDGGSAGALCDYIQSNVSGTQVVQPRTAFDSPHVLATPTVGNND